MRSSLSRFHPHPRREWGESPLTQGWHGSVVPKKAPSSGWPYRASRKGHAGFFYFAQDDGFRQLCE
eukprot:9075755-Pyramimonas_sp.AAC.1